MTVDDVQALHQARRAAEVAAKAASALVDFAERLANPPGAAEMAEYDTLVAREAAAQSRRRDAFREVGLAVPSIDGAGRGGVTEPFFG